MMAPTKSKKALVLKLKMGQCNWTLSGYSQGIYQEAGYHSNISPLQIHSSLLQMNGVVFVPVIASFEITFAAKHVKLSVKSRLHIQKLNIGKYGLYYCKVY